MSRYLPVNVTIVLSFFIFIFYLLGVKEILKSHKKNDCEMTFMFQYPQFVEISMPDDIQRTYAKYALYGYSEGGFTEQLRKMKFKGIPVLFIPGSSGSYKQGRSLASISLRKSLNSRIPFHFNYFMVDFNEEQSGIFGGILQEQTKFVSLCIKKILSLYQNNDEPNKPESVILIGHSLGGVIAKGVLKEPDLDPKFVKLIISLSSPHKYPIIQFDYYITSYYKVLNDFWFNNSDLKHITLISIGGGPKDIVAGSDVIFDHYSDINVLTTAIPDTWLSNDHLSIMWCKQLITTIVRAMFDSVDLHTKQLSTKKNLVTSAFEYHLIKRSAGKKYSTSMTNRFATFERSQYWFENLQRQFTVTEADGLRTNHYIMIRLFSDPKNEMAFIEAYNINVKDWIYVCFADVVYHSIRMCDSGENISNITEIAPVDLRLKLKRKFVYLDLFDLKSKLFSHVVIKLPAANTYMSVNVDVYKASERSIHYNVPSLYSVSAKTIIANTTEGSLSYIIHLNGFEYIWQSYTVMLESLNCKLSHNNAIMSFIVPWSNESQHFYFEDTKILTATLGITFPKSKNIHSGVNPIVRLHLDPICQYQVKIQPSIIGMFAQGVRFYSLMLPAFLATVVILTVRQQIIFLHQGKCVLLLSALSVAVRRYYIVLQATILGSKILGFSLFFSFLPKPDLMLLQELNLNSFFFTILLYAVAIIVTYSAGATCYVAVILSGQAAHKVALRFMAKAASGIINWSDWVMSALHQIPFIAAGILLSISLATCGALSLWLGVFFYFLKLCKMYEEYLDEWFKYSIKIIGKTIKKVISKDNNRNTTNNENETINEQDCQNSEEEKSVMGTNSEENNESKVDTLSAIHFHASVFLIWLLIALLHVPSLLMWAKNYDYSIFLEKDPSKIPSIMVTACGAVLWQSSVPKRHRKLSRITTSILFILAIVSIIYASVSLYRLGFILCFALFVICINQYISL